MDVKDSMTLKDDTIEVRLLNIPNPHVDGMVIAHVVGPNLVYVTDLISPRGPIGRSPATVAVGDALRKADISGATIVGGHGTTAKQADIGSGAGRELTSRAERLRGVRAPRFFFGVSNILGYGSSSVSQ